MNLKALTVTESPNYSDRLPDHMGCDLRIHVDGDVYETHKRDQDGFYERPMTWDTVPEKFTRLAELCTDAALREDINGAVQVPETIPATDLSALLIRGGAPNAVSGNSFE